MQFTIDDLQLIQVLFTETAAQGLLDGNKALLDVKAKVDDEIKRVCRPDEWEKDRREIQAAEEAKRWNAVGCAVGRALAVAAKGQASFSISSKDLRALTKEVNRWEFHPSSITGVLMRRLHLAEPMFKKLTKAKACRFIYDRDSKCLTGEVEI